MKNKLIVYDINRIILVDKKEYPENKTIFSSEKLIHHELIYHFSGDAMVYFNDEILHTPPNTIRYLPIGNCSRYIVDRIEQGDCIDICFSSNIPLAEKAFVYYDKNKNIATLFKKIFSVWCQKNEGYYLESVSLLYKILAEMQKTSYISDTLFEKIKPIIDYIHENFLNHEIITADKMTSLSGISYSYIKKLFKLKYKVTPKKYILQLKLNHASDLLRHHKYSVSKIAEICGYNDVYSFSHQFKLEFGLSPTDFVKKYKSSK